MQDKKSSYDDTVVCKFKAIIMEKQEMTPPPATAHPPNYIVTPQMPSDMDWSFFLSDPHPHPKQVPSQYEMPSASVTTTLVSEDQTKISNCDDHDHLKEEEEEEEEDEQDRNKEKRRASRVSRGKAAGPPRVEFQTKSSEDLLDDGYRWRKYGRNLSRIAFFPEAHMYSNIRFRSYYRCTHRNVKKQVQRLSEDTSIVVTTYEGIHNHPCEHIMETLSPLLKQMQFLAHF
ncbi:hypothetical protein ACET3Z_016846 [Daucus carota]